jgi:hypothetical protein
MIALYVYIIHNASSMMHRLGGRKKMEVVGLKIRAHNLSAL